MAWTFSEQIHALTGLDAASNSDSETGEDFRVLSAQWLVDAAREVISILPPELKMKCASITNLYIGNTDTTMDMDGKGNILHVTRENADSGYYVGCREVSSIHADSANDSTSLHYATATDPVYWIESNSSGASTLFVKPTPTALQPAKINHIAHPSIAYGDTSISNFPDEAEYLVVLRAAITAAEYQLAIEEDAELYSPIIINLNNKYVQGINSIVAGHPSPPKKKSKDDD